MKKRNSLLSVVPFPTDYHHKLIRFALIIESFFLLFLGMGGHVFAQNRAGESSPLATGRWVKISVDKSGLYTLSYDKLRQMGFSNPEAVGVYGRGGRLLSEDLQKASSVAGLPQVPLLRHNNAIYFYGEGTTTTHALGTTSLVMQQRPAPYSWRNANQQPPKRLRLLPLPTMPLYCTSETYSPPNNRDECSLESLS